MYVLIDFEFLGFLDEQHKILASMNISFKLILTTTKFVYDEQAARQIANPFQLRIGFLFPDRTQVESYCKVPSLEGGPQAPLRYFVTFRKADGGDAVEYANKDLSTVQPIGYLYQLFHFACDSGKAKRSKSER